MGNSSAAEHMRRQRERTRYAYEQLRRQRADRGYPADQQGTTREAHAAEHRDRSGDRGPSLADAEVPNSKKVK